MTPRERIAVIGGGIAGLTAAYLLSRRYLVTLYEKERQLGGNAYTFDTRDGHRVDIAVAAFGRAGYPHFYRLLAELGIRAAISPGALTSMRDLDTGEGLYLTPSLAGLWAQRFAVLGPRSVAGILALRAGLLRGMRMLDEGRLDLPLGEALARIPGLERDDQPARLMFLFALCLLSSMSCAEVLAAPASFFFDKLRVHHDVLSPSALWSIRCVPGGTRRYVDAMAARFAGGVVLGAHVRCLVRDQQGVDVVLEGGERRRFEHVVMAVNADQALAMLAEPTARERELLGSWRYKEGTLIVHGDLSAFPPPPLIQAYTFLYTRRNGGIETSVNGCLWREPGVSRSCRLLSTQHPNFPIREDRIELRAVMRTPIFDQASCRTVAALPSLNGTRRTFYCGSHFGHGLHEDAVASAIAAARGLGVESTF